MAQPEPYTYTDPSGDTLTIGRTSNVVTLKAQVGDEAADIHVLVEDVEEVVTAIRAAAGTQPGANEQQGLLKSIADLAVDIGHARQELARVVLGQDQASEDMGLGQIVASAVAEYRSEVAAAGRLRAERDEARGQCTEMETQHRFASEEAQGRIDALRAELEQARGGQPDRAAVLREAGHRLPDATETSR